MSPSPQTGSPIAVVCNVGCTPGGVNDSPSGCGKKILELLHIFVFYLKNKKEMKVYYYLTYRLTLAPSLGPYIRWSHTTFCTKVSWRNSGCSTM